MEEPKVRFESVNLGICNVLTRLLVEELFEGEPNSPLGGPNSNDNKIKRNRYP